MHGLCVMQGSTVLFFAEGGGGMLGFGFNQTIIYAKFLFLIVGEEQSAMERTVQESQPSHSSTRKQGDAASASSQCEDTLGKNANNTWQNRCFLSHIIFSLTFGSLTFKGHFPLSCFVLQSYGLIATRLCISMIPYFLEEQPGRLLSFSHNKGAIIHYETFFC